MYVYTYIDIVGVQRRKGGGGSSRLYTLGFPGLDRKWRRGEGVGQGEGVGSGASSNKFEYGVYIRGR